jgi:hypothetical protein
LVGFLLEFVTARKKSSADEFSLFYPPPSSLSLYLDSVNKSLTRRLPATEIWSFFFFHGGSDSCCGDIRENKQSKLSSSSPSSCLPIILPFLVRLSPHLSRARIPIPGPPQIKSKLSEYVLVTSPLLILFLFFRSRCVALELPACLGAWTDGRTDLDAGFASCLPACFGRTDSDVGVASCFAASCIYLPGLACPHLPLLDPLHLR